VYFRGLMVACKTEIDMAWGTCLLHGMCS